MTPTIISGSKKAAKFISGTKCPGHKAAQNHPHAQDKCTVDLEEKMLRINGRKGIYNTIQEREQYADDRNIQCRRISSGHEKECAKDSQKCGKHLSL